MSLEREFQRLGATSEKHLSLIVNLTHNGTHNSVFDDSCSIQMGSQGDEGW